MSSRESAIEWWITKNELTVTKKDSEIKPDIKIIKKFFRNYSPQFLSVRKYAKYPERYYSNVEYMLYSICGKRPPFASSNFLDFLTFLYKNRRLIHPISIKDCTTLYSVCSYKKDISFLTKKFPIMVFSPKLLIDTLYDWMCNNHAAWNIMVSNNGAIAAIIDSLLSFYSENPFTYRFRSDPKSKKTNLNRRYNECMRYKYIILEIVKNGIEECWRKGNDVDLVCVDVIRYAKLKLKDMNIELAANITRLVFTCFNLISKRYKEKDVLYAEFLADASETDIYFMISKYCSLTKKSQIEDKEVVKKIKIINNLDDLKHLEVWMNSRSAAHVTKLLLDILYRRHGVFNRCAMNILVRFLKKSNFPRVRTLVFGFIRSYFFYFAMNFRHRQYDQNFARILSNFAELKDTVPWLKGFIPACAGSLVKTRTNSWLIRRFIKPLGVDRILYARISKKVQIKIVKRKVPKKFSKKRKQF